MANHLFELVGKRTENAKHWQMSDGTIQAQFYTYPIHYLDENGIWQNIDHTLQDAADFDLMTFPVSVEIIDTFYLKRDEVTAHKRKVSLDRLKHDFHALRVPYFNRVPRYFSRGYDIGKGNDKLTLIPVGTSVSLGHIDTTKSPHKIAYADVWNDTDVTLEIQTLGIKETIILKSNNSPTTFSFEVLGGITDDLTSPNGFIQIQPAWLVDAAGTKRDVQQKVRRENGKVYIDLIADVTGLQYPIMIDPTATFTYNSTGATRATVEDNFPNSSVAGFQIGKWSATPSYVTRGLVKWDISSIPQGAHVTSATFSGNWASSQPSSVYGHFYNITSPWTTSVTWNTQPTYDPNTKSAAFQLTNANLSNVDITPIAQAWVNNPAGQYGMIGISDTETAYGAIAFSWDASFVVTINYTSPPTAPTVTSPNGGEVVNTTYTITWNPATDPDTPQSSLTYQIDLSRDGGNTWTNIVNQTAAGVTSYTYDFSSIQATTQAKIRIRAYDGASYGPYDVSDNVFTIDHSPTAPINLTPSGGSAQDRARPITVSWNFTDPDAGNTQSKFDIKYSTNGGSTWTQIDFIVSTQSQYTFAANTFPHGNVLWAVRTYDQNGLVSPWSQQATFLAADKPATPNITSPSTIGVSNPTVTWASSGQVGYEFQVRDTNNNVLWDDTKLSSTSQNELENGVNLQNNTNYVFAVRILNSDGLWSDWAIQNVTVSYTPPATPTLTVTPIHSNGYMMINITNPVPQGTQPNVTGHDLYRRIAGTTSWTRIATGIPNNGVYKDYAAASGVSYEYKVTAYGDNSTVTDSAIYSNTMTLSGVWIHDVSNPAGTILNVPFNDKRGETWTPDATFMKFAGRTRPVVEFGEQEEFKYKVTVSLTQVQALWQKLSSLIRSKKTLCVRDYRGRKVFGVITSLPESDTFFGQEVTLEVTEIAYQEAV